MNVYSYYSKIIKKQKNKNKNIYDLDKLCLRIKRGEARELPSLVKTSSHSALVAQKVVRKERVHGVTRQKQFVKKRPTRGHLLLKTRENLVFGKPNDTGINALVFIQHLLLFATNTRNGDPKVLIGLTRIQKGRPVHKEFDILCNQTRFLTDFTLCSVKNGAFALIQKSSRNLEIVLAGRRPKLLYESNFSFLSNDNCHTWLGLDDSVSELITIFSP